MAVSVIVSHRPWAKDKNGGAGSLPLLDRLIYSVPIAMSEAERSRQQNTDSEKTLLESFLLAAAILLKYRWLIIIMTGVVALGSVGFSVASLLLPPEQSPLPNHYTAHAMLLVHKGLGDTLSSSILAALGLESQSQETVLGFETGSLLVLVLQSRTLVDKIIEEFDLGQKYGTGSQAKIRSRQMFLSKADFAYNRTTATVSISFDDIDPVFARDVTNRMISLLSEWFAQNIGSSNLRQKQQLEEKLQEVKTDVDSLENRLKELQKKYGVLGAQDLGTSQASALAALRAQLILKEIEIKNYSAVAAIVDPKLRQLQNERKNILDMIGQTQQGLTGAQGSSSGQKSLSDIQTEFNRLSVELDVQQKIYNTLSQQYEVLKLTTEPASAFQVMELAETPDQKSGPSRSRIVMMATVAGFVASASLAFFLHALARLKRRRNGAATDARGG